MRSGNKGSRHQRRTKTPNVGARHRLVKPGACPSRPQRVTLHLVHEPPIRTRATVVRIVSPILAEVSLPNGKVTLGHLSRELADENTTLAENNTVELEMTPFDFDTARISKIIR